MKFSNEEMVSAKDEVVSSLEYAIGEIKGMNKYKEVADNLQEIIDQIKEIAEPYEEAYNKELQKRSEEDEAGYWSGRW